MNNHQWYGLLSTAIYKIDTAEAYLKDKKINTVKIISEAEFLKLIEQPSE